MDLKNVLKTLLIFWVCSLSAINSQTTSKLPEDSKRFVDRSTEKDIHPSKRLYQGVDVAAHLKRGNVIIYTAHQLFDSRIYLLDVNGSVINYFEYFNFRFVDLEIVNNGIFTVGYIENG